MLDELGVPPENIAFDDFEVKINVWKCTTPSSQHAINPSELCWKNKTRKIRKEQPTTSLIYLTMVFFTKAVDSLLAGLMVQCLHVPTSIISRINNNEECYCRWLFQVVLICWSF
jgi:hypothetical protein